MSFTLLLPEAQVCEIAERIVIARVELAEAFRDDRAGEFISTAFTLRVEAVAHGAPPLSFRVVVPGGTLEQESVVDFNAPRLAVGGRYLFLLMRRGPSYQPPAVPESGFVVLHAYRLDAEYPLPEDRLLAETWRFHCEPGAASIGVLNASSPFLDDLPPWFLEWCSHI